jgi:hypothetical protein
VLRHPLGQPLLGTAFVTGELELSDVRQLVRNEA